MNTWSYLVLGLAFCSLFQVSEISDADQSTSTNPPPAERCAIIAGISDYEHKPDWNLKYAKRDAEELCQLLQTPSGAAFSKDHIRLLTNEIATTDYITRAVSTFLKKPAEIDVVLLYFSCHGAQAAERPADGLSAENRGLLLPETCYRLGRALYERGEDLDSAVSELRRAVKRSPANARSQYYLGLAIRRLAEQDLLAKAREHLRIYYEVGRPLEDREAVRSFMALASGAR